MTDAPEHINIQGYGEYILATPSALSSHPVVMKLVAEAVHWGFISAAPGEWRVSDIQRVTEAINAAAIRAKDTP